MMLVPESAKPPELAEDIVARPLPAGRKRLGKPNKRGKRRSRKKPTGQITDQDRNSAQRKLKDPSKYPYMTAREVAAALGISIKSVYEHSEIARFRTGTRKCLWTTESVLAVRNSPQ